MRHRGEKRGGGPVAGRGKVPKFLLKILGVVLTVLLLLLAAAALILA